MTTPPTLHARHDAVWQLETPAARRLAATALHRASALLARLARQMAQPTRARPRSQPQLEYHAEAGAPEGALYVDGRLVGWLQGVRRL